MVTKFLNKLQNKRVLVVGGSSGIGYGLAEGLVEHGALVVIASRTQANIDAAVAKLKETYPEHADNIKGHAISIDDSPDVEDRLTALFDFATNQGKEKLDHVVETAGDLALMGKVTMETVTPALISEASKVRLVGTIMLSKVAARYLLKEPSSSFTMTTGVLVSRPSKGMSPTLSISGSKELLTRSLAVDLAPIRVNTISPGAVETELLYSLGPPGAPRDQARQQYSKMSLLGRVADVGDLAEAYLSLIKNNFQTGTVVQVDGGYLLT